MNETEKQEVKKSFFEVEGAHDMLLAIVAQLGLELALTKCGSKEPLVWLSEVRDMAAAKIIKENIEGGAAYNGAAEATASAVLDLAGEYLNELEK